MSKCDFISAQTSAHAVDAVAVDLASVLAAMIVRWGAALHQTTFRRHPKESVNPRNHQEHVPKAIPSGLWGFVDMRMFWGTFVAA